MNEHNDLYFGGCPICGEAAYVNIGRAHWFYCNTHRVKWCVGSNLFSSWKDETPEYWERNSRQLADYTEIEPVYSVGDTRQRKRQELSSIAQHVQVQDEDPFAHDFSHWTHGDDRIDTIAAELLADVDLDLDWEDDDPFCRDDDPF